MEMESVISKRNRQKSDTATKKLELNLNRNRNIEIRSVICVTSLGVQIRKQLWWDEEKYRLWKKIDVKMTVQDI